MNKGWSKLGGLLGIAYCVAGVFLIFFFVARTLRMRSLRIRS